MGTKDEENSKSGFFKKCFTNLIGELLVPKKRRAMHSNYYMQTTSVSSFITPFTLNWEYCNMKRQIRKISIMR